jgi:hypothetical protein
MEVHLIVCRLKLVEIYKSLVASGKHVIFTCMLEHSRHFGRNKNIDKLLSVLPSKYKWLVIFLCPGKNSINTKLTVA